MLLSIERFKGLAKRGFEVIVFTSGYPGFPSKQLDQGLRIYRSPAIGAGRIGRATRRAIYPFWAFWMLLWMRFDIFYQGDTAGVDPATSTLIVWGFTCLAHFKKARAVIVHSLANTNDLTFDTAGWEGFWRKVMYSCFDVVVAVSPALYRGLQAVFPQRACMIVNGVRDDIFTPLAEWEHQKFRDEHGVTDEQVVFTYLGTVSLRKGFDLLAEAFAQLAGQNPHWRVWVIGPYTKQHSQNINQDEAQLLIRILKPFATQVTYWGRVDDRHQLNRILSASDVFVFPSRREGMGLAPVEAMAAGVPSIIARIPDVTDLANIEGETGLYIPVDDPLALRAAMQKLGRNPALRQQMGDKAVAQVHKLFSWESHLDRWQQLFERFEPLRDKHR